MLSRIRCRLIRSTHRSAKASSSRTSKKTETMSWKPCRVSDIAESRTNLKVAQRRMLAQSRDDDPLELRSPPRLLLRRVPKPRDEGAIDVKSHLVLVRVPRLLDRRIRRFL